jgi:6-phosphofructokinase 1
MQQIKIGVLTSGGDCPGLNAVIRGICRAAYKLNWEVLGFKDGFEGLLPPGDYMELDRKSTSGIMHLGGTILGTTNRGHFVAKVAAGERAMIPKKIIDEAKETFNKLGLTALIAIGGDGSLSTALQLHEEGIPIIGVPKTIDNDLKPLRCWLTPLRMRRGRAGRLHTTATSQRVMVLKSWGIRAGSRCMAGLPGADVILILRYL